MPSVKITCDTPNVSIYYTTDGADPNESSSLYSNILDINESLTIKAKAYKEGWIESEVASLEVSLSQLPTPEGYIRVEGVGNFYLVLTNQSSYPDNAVIVFDTNEAPVEETSVSDASKGQIIYGMSCIIFARCNGYLDSESIEISEIRREDYY